MSAYESNTTTTTYTSTYSSDGGVTSNVSTHSTHSSTTLYINAVSATQLIACQRFGKQDPYLQFSLDINEKDSFIKTFTHKNAGENAVWNQSFTIDLKGESNLYVEVLNQETTVDEVIGFSAIPINQVVHANGAYMNGVFDVYDIKGERAGALNLQLAAKGFPNSQEPKFTGEPVRGQSFVHDSHKERMNASKTKKTGIAVGTALLGGALAAGAGYLGKKVYDNQKEKNENEKNEEEEKARLEKEKEEKQAAFEAERQRLEAEKAEFEKQKKSDESKKESHEEKKVDESHKVKKECEPKKKECEPKKKECEPKKKECEPKKKECEPKKKECEPKKKDCKPKKKNRDDSGSSSDSGSDSDSGKKKKDCKPKKKDCDDKKKDCKPKKDCDSDGKNWNPTGTYSAGDRVKYHGKTFVCLQGHTSNPTWTPDAAHSLWQNA